MKRERLEEVAEILDKRGKMTLEQLEEAFPDVSQMTLRRDLSQLEIDGRVIRIRGGAMSVKEVQKVSGEAYTKKTTVNMDAKIVIAQKAATLIDEGTSIFIDGGTTAMYLSKEMPDIKCNIFTNGIAVAMELAQKKNVEITVVGGQLMKDNLSTSSPAAKEYFPIRVTPTIAVYGPGGEPYDPPEDLGINFMMYTYRDSGEHAFTIHEGYLYREQLDALIEALRNA